MLKRKGLFCLIFILTVSLLVVGCFNDNDSQEKNDEVKEKQAVNSQVSKLAAGIGEQDSEDVEEVISKEGVTVKFPNGEEKSYSADDFKESIGDETLKKLFKIKDRRVTINGDTAEIKGTAGKSFRGNEIEQKKKGASLSAFLHAKTFNLWKEVRLPGNDEDEEGKTEGYVTYEGNTFDIDYPAQWVKFNCGIEANQFKFETLVTGPAETNAGFIVANWEGGEDSPNDSSIPDASSIIKEIEKFLKENPFYEADEPDSIELSGYEEAGELKYTYGVSYYPTTVKIKVKKKDNKWVIVRIEINRGEEKTLIVKNKLIVATNQTENRIGFMFYRAAENEYNTYLPKIEDMINSFKIKSETENKISF